MPQGKFKNKSQVSFAKKKKHEPNKSRKGNLFNILVSINQQRLIVNDKQFVNFCKQVIWKFKTFSQSPRGRLNSLTILIWFSFIVVIDCIVGDQITY